MRWSSSIVDLVRFNLQKNYCKNACRNLRKYNSQIQGVFNCSGHHVLGWRNIWDSAEHWSWVERPKGAGGIELCRVLNCILQVVFLHQVHWAAIQPAPAGWLQHIAGNGEKSNLDSIHHLCQHCYTGDEDVMYKQFTFFINFFLDQFGFGWLVCRKGA